MRISLGILPDIETVLMGLAFALPVLIDVFTGDVSHALGVGVFCLLLSVVANQEYDYRMKSLGLDC